MYVACYTKNKRRLEALPPLKEIRSYESNPKKW